MMRTPLRAEVLGSLLRPSYLTAARERFVAGEMSAHDFKEVEDRAVDEAIALQEGSGLDVVTDGEMRRQVYFDQLVDAVEGMEEVEGAASIKFRGFGDEPDAEYQLRVAVTQRLRVRRMVTVEEFAYARGQARRPVKVTMPSPMQLYSLWSKTHSRDAYPDAFDLFEHGAEIIRDEVKELAALGCGYIQIDAPQLAHVGVDAGQRERWRSLGIDLDRVLTEGVDLLNAIADVPGVTFGLHMCRGNFQSKWVAEGGYDDIVRDALPRLGNYDIFLMEYDDARSGSFEPLKDVATTRCGPSLVSSKLDAVESPDSIVERVREASRFVDLERLSISTQCGFASAVAGNLVSRTSQEAKLRVVGQVADELWG